MNRFLRHVIVAPLFLIAACLTIEAQAQDWPPGGSDIPASYQPPQLLDEDFVRRDVMIPMRDGARLHTVLMMRKGVEKGPIILDRLPYSADRYTKLSGSASFRGRVIPLHADLIEAGYILALQDVRGKHGSEGDYVMNRPLSGPLNPTAVDHSTDAYDSIDWLVKNVKESSGGVGSTGISYGGFTALMTLVDPHPALKASAPIDPMVDGWVGDDWFHNGAFRQTNLRYFFLQTSRKDSSLPWVEPAQDTYEGWLRAGSAGAMAAERGVDKLPFWQRLSRHPAYDRFWQQQAMDRILASRPLTVPTMLVHGQWDQEDIYGSLAVYRALEPKDVANDKVFLAIGPWNHGGAGLESGATLGKLEFGSETSVWFRRNILIPFFDRWLKEDAAAAAIPPVIAFETGSNTWRSLERWPLACHEGCTQKLQRLYFQPGQRLSPTPPSASGRGYDEYISDPDKPVTYKVRPIRPAGGGDPGWSNWLVDDQRFAADRSDVLVYVSDVLEKPVRLAGEPIAHLFASTSGRDSDWVVKLIDVYPGEVPGEPGWGGYQLPVSMDIMRGRYRKDPAKPAPVEPNRVEPYRIKLPHASHVFLPGHRIMIQVQSSWFPLYDRNPQSWVDNILFAKPEDYVRATQRVFRRPGALSAIDLPVAAGDADR